MRAQIDTITSFVDRRDVSFVTIFAVGATWSELRMSRASLGALPDEDYSVIAESMYRAGQIDADQSVAVGEEIETFIAATRSTVAASATHPVERIMAALDFYDIGADTLDIEGLRRYVVRLRRHRLHIVGPDLLSSLLALIDPWEKLDKPRLVRMFDIFRSWGIEEAALSLLLARALAPETEVLEFLRANERRVLHLSSGAARNLRNLLDPDGQRTPTEQRHPSWVERLIHGLSRLKLSLRWQSPIDAHAPIVRLFALDRRVVDFLPWNGIAELVDRESRSGAEALVTTMIMRSKPIQRLSKRVAIRFGTGALIGDLIGFIQADKRTELTTLFRRFRGLPPEAASALARTVLEPPVFERLIGATSARALLADELATRGLDVHLLRIEALRQAAKADLLPSDYVEKEIEFENEQARLQLFEQSMRLGRVRVPWEAIEKASREITQSFPLEALRFLPENEELVNRVANYSSLGITRHILFDSPVSIDQTLSNNLRHGVLVPRFLRSFDDALLLLEPRRRQLPTWTPASLDRFFGRDSAALIALREWVNDDLKAFLVTHLTIQQNGQLHLALQGRIGELLRSTLSATRQASGALEKKIAQATELTVKQSLTVASRYLGTTTKSAIFARLKLTRKVVGRGTQSASFLDALEGNLHHAFEDVVEWIGIANNDVKSGPFTLDELVKLELMTTYLASWRQLSVVTRCYHPERSTTLHPMIRGEYLDLFQDVLHNLIANCFKYSGLGHRTRIQVDLRSSGHELTLSCSNDISPEHVGRLASQYADTLAKARRSLDRSSSRRDRGAQAMTIDPQARGDKLSGFLKMKLAFLRNLDSDVSINILPISERRRRFTVVLTFRSPPNIWHDHA